MYTEKVTYEDFEGNTQEEELNFHLTQAELLELETSMGSGMSAVIKLISKTKDMGRVVMLVREFALKAYGEPIVDSKGRTRFVKNQEMRDAFASSEVYSTFFMSLAKDPNKLNAFLIGIMPKALQEEIAKAELEGGNPVITIDA